jgi:diguanylate cyclase (GGDEF)-like protein
MTRAPSHNEQISPIPFVLITIATLTAWVVIFLSFSHGYRMTAKNSGLIDAAMEIKLEATYAHLWFEEIMSGDSEENIDEVMAHIDEAVWYANAMLNGGKNAEGTFFALEEDSLRFAVEGVLEELATFKALTHERHSNFVSSKPGSDIDIKYDETFDKFITLSDDTETALQRLVATELAEFERLHYLMAISVLLVAAGLAGISWNHEKRRVAYLQFMRDKQGQLELLSHTDPLTGVGNRRAFDEILTCEFRRALRDGNPLGLIMIDVDFFKSYNDNYGHQQGDHCLKEVASALNKSCNRTTDLVARYGGEEFAVILPNTEHAKQLAQTLRESVENAAIAHSGSGVADVVTISLGVTTEVPTVDMQLDDLIASADKALYEAKKTGRNRVVERAMCAKGPRVMGTVAS